MPISYACQNMNFTQLGTVGQCFTEFVFFGDLGLASLLILIALTFIAVKAQLPLEVMFPSLLGFTFALWLISGSPWLMGLFIIGLLIGGALLALSILQNLARG